MAQPEPTRSSLVWFGSDFWKKNRKIRTNLTREVLIGSDNGFTQIRSKSVCEQP